MSSFNHRKNIGYITPFIWGDISLSYFRGVLETVKNNDLNLICYIGQRFNDSVNFNYQANIIYQMMDESWMDGLVIWASQIGELLSKEDYLNLSKRFPQVPITTIAGSIGDHPAVMSDDLDSVGLLFEHLYHVHGMRKIGFARGVKDHPLSEGRYQSYLDILAKYEIELDPKMITPYNEFTYEAGIEGAKYYQQNFNGSIAHQMEGIICASDSIARGVIDQLKHFGYQIPKELAVVGINNKADSRQSLPALTTVDPQIKQIGIYAAELLLEILKGSPVKNTHSIKPSLVIRQSCGCSEVRSRLGNNDINTKPKSLNEDFDYLCSQQLDIEKSIQEALTNSNIDNKNDVSKKLLSHFLSSLDRPDCTSFIDYLKSIFSELRKDDEDIAIWQGLISVLRKIVLPMLHSDEMVIRLQDLIHQAHVEVDMAYEYQLAANKSKADIFLRTISEANATLRTSYDFNELMTVFSRILPSLEIPGCYIVLFGYKGQTHWGRLVYGYEHNEILELGQGIVFPTKDLLPTHFLKRKDRYTLFVQSLYFREENLGYIVFEAGPIDKSIYQVLTGEVSGAIYRSRIFNSLILAEREKAKLLHRLEEKNSNLEHIVEERTAAIRQANRQLEEAIVTAQNANAAKSQFLANMSHEIRTPLNCIIGFADMIKAISKDDMISNYIQLTIDETEKLLLLINQLLDISKIEAGKFHLNIEPMSLEHLMHSIISTYSVSTEAKGLNFEFQLSQDIPPLFKADSLRLRQVLVNLIGNAIKFTDHGAITVTSRYIKVPQPMLYMAIEDTGIGIDEHRLEAIFKLFEQENTTTSKEYGGTGLGTAISKQLVELMGGRIGVNSKKHQGSTFFFEIPIYLLTQEELNSYSNGIPQNHLDLEGIGNQYSHKKILLVEDYPPNRMLATGYLKSLNCEIVDAFNGQEALEQLEKHNIDLILMDVQMPIMDGVQATQEIRTRTQYDKIPIIGMTANAFETDIAFYKEIGMNEVITKPFRKASMVHTIIGFLDGEGYYGNFRKNSNEIETTQVYEEGQLPIFQYERILKNFDYDHVTLDELIKDFVVLTQEKLVDLTHAIENHDIQSVKEISHTIKGSALNMTADVLGNTARLIEAKAQDDVLDGTEELMTLLDIQFEALQRYLKEKLGKP